MYNLQGGISRVLAGSAFLMGAIDWTGTMGGSREAKRGGGEGGERGGEVCDLMGDLGRRVARPS